MIQVTSAVHQTMHTVVFFDDNSSGISSYYYDGISGHALQTDMHTLSAVQQKVYDDFCSDKTAK